MAAQPVSEWAHDRARATDFDSSVGSAAAEPAHAPRGPADLASDAVTAFQRSTAGVRDATAKLRQASERSERRQWVQARGLLDRELAYAARSLDRVRARQADIKPDVAARLLDAERELAGLQTTAASLVDEPAGFRTTAADAEIERVLAAPVETDFKLGYETKQAQLFDIIDGLSVVEARMLVERFVRPPPGDRVAQLFQRLASTRQQIVLDRLRDAPRRMALQTDRAPKTLHVETTPGRETISEVENLDSKLREILERGDSELELIGVLATLDDRRRRELAQRFERHRQGSGDEIAARFIRLERPVRLRMLAVLSAPGPGRLPDEVRGDLESATVPMRAQATSPSAVDMIQQSIQAQHQILTEVDEPDVAWAYLRSNHDHFLAAISKRLAGTALPPYARMTWLPNGLESQFVSALTSALGTRPLFIGLPELLYPVDPWYVIDHNRVISEGIPGVKVDSQDAKGPRIWSPLAGEALAVEVLLRLRESMDRMVPRFLTQLEVKAPARAVVGDLVTSHPMDRVSARLLCDEHVVKPSSATRGVKSKPNTDPTAFRPYVRFLDDYRWLGDTDPQLWNWIEVRAPLDATVEDVAATLWLDPDASHRAYGITAAPPFFRVVPSFARLFDGAKAHAPSGLDQPHEEHALAIAESAFATDAAIAQAADERRFDRRGIPLAPDLARLTTLLERSGRQLERAAGLLSPWKLSDLVVGARRWVSAHREHVLSIPDGRLVRLTPAIEGQQQILFEAVGAIQEIGEAVGQAAGRDNEDSPLTSVLRQYAIAIGESHLIDTSRAALIVARRAKAELALSLLDRSVRDTQVTISEQRASESLIEYGGTAAQADSTSYHRQILELRTKQGLGQAVDAAEIELLAANVKEHAIDARAKSLYLQFHNLSEQTRDAGFGAWETLASGFSADFRTLPSKLRGLMSELNTSVIEARVAAKAQAIRDHASGAHDKRTLSWATDQATQVAEREFDAFVQRHKLKEIFAEAIEKLEHQAQRTAAFQIIAQIALLIGLSIVSAGVGSVIGGAVRGALLADAATASIGMLRTARTAQLVGTVVGLGAEAATNALGTMVLTDESGGKAFFDSFVASATLRVALAPLQKVAAAWGALAGRNVEHLGVWARTARRAVVLRGAAVLTAEMITGAAVDYAIKRAHASGHTPDEDTALGWAIQGASMVVGRFISGRLSGLEARLGQLAEHGAHLLRRTKRMRVLAERVENTGDKQAALELLIEHHDVLASEAKLLGEIQTLSKGKITQQTVSTLELGNHAELGGVQDAAFATLPLRLAGLTPDDASGKVWVGKTEDISIALHQASRTGLAVEVLDHDHAARQWHVRYNQEKITIVETSLEGQPRPAKAAPSDADRQHAARYAEAAEFMQERWEAKVKLDLDARAVVQVDHLQVGYAFAGVVNQATLPATGDALDHKLVVYAHKGTLVGRGKQELGQHPTKWDAPGVRGSEQSPRDAAWITSEQHKRSLEVGRLEVQTPAYQGTVVELETRPKGPLPEGQHPWPQEAASRAFRVRIRDAAGTERWFYCDRFDNTGGMGPADLKQVARVVDRQALEPMLAADQLLRGDDPDYARKLKRGRILVWGGTPTGSWAAEPAVQAGSHVTVLGDQRPARADWPALIREYEDVTRVIARLPSSSVPPALTARKQSIEAQIQDAHRGMTLPRNRKPGATYGKPLSGRGVDDAQIEFGTPSRIAAMPDGRVLVTVGTGDTAHTTIYDQVVVAHGQDSGAPGAPGSLLGPGAAEKASSDGTRAYGEVPAGTIMLEPVWGPKRDGQEPEVLSLRSVAPEGIELKGAAYASKRMSPWIKPSERARFERAVDQMAAEHAPTRDHGQISEHSTNVATGVEVQRDRMPRANEIFAARAYRLPGPDRTLELDPAHTDRWDTQVREFFAIQLRANHEWVRVERLGGGKSAAVLYRVSVDGTEVGVFKLFDSKAGAANEQAMLRELEHAKLKSMVAVRERGRIALDPKTGFHEALLMDTAKGTSLKQLLEHMPADRAARDEAILQLKFAMTRIADGLAELHTTFGSTNNKGGTVMMTTESKLSDANYFLDHSVRAGSEAAQVRAALGDADFARVKAALEGPELQAFVAADVPASAYHGDANGGNFILDGYDRQTGFKDLGVIDVGSMFWSVDLRTHHGTKTGAADVARVLGSLETIAPGTLRPEEIAGLRSAFKVKYFAVYQKLGGHPLDRASYEQAERWYRLEMELAVLKSDPRSKPRVMKLFGLEPTP